MSEYNSLQPLVSVIVPVYKAEKNIQICVKSIQKQKYKNLEIILIDDGSPDSSGEICETLASEDSRIRVIHVPNGGVSRARNVGIDSAKGDYIQFIDSDDTLSDDAIYSMLQSILKVDLVVSDYIEYNPCHEKEIVKKAAAYGSMSLESYSRVFSGNGALSFYFSVVWNKMYKRCILRNNKIYFEEDVSFAEDFLFNLKYLTYCNRIHVLDKVTYVYVTDITKESLSNNKKNIESIWENRKKVLWPAYEKYYKDTGLINQYPNEPNLYYILSYGNGIYVLFKAGYSLIQVWKITKKRRKEEKWRFCSMRPPSGIRGMIIYYLTRLGFDLLSTLIYAVFWRFKKYK